MTKHPVRGWRRVEAARFESDGSLIDLIAHFGSRPLCESSRRTARCEWCRTGTVPRCDAVEVSACGSTEQDVVVQGGFLLGELAGAPREENQGGPVDLADD